MNFTINSMGTGQGAVVQTWGLLHNALQDLAVLHVPVTCLMLVGAGVELH